MKAAVDNIWASPSTLHLRVLVWVGESNFMKKFEVAVPLDEIEPQALQALTVLARDPGGEMVDRAQASLW